MKRGFTVVELEKVAKYLDGLNKLSYNHGVGISSGDDIYLVMDGQTTPFYLVEDDDELSLVVSV